MPSGGNHPPRQAAMVSGPGALSQRTDGQPVRDLPDARYGENKAFTAAQAGAPMASQPPLSGGGGAPALDLSQLVGLGEPSLNPDEPVTAGAAAGAGAGPEALGLPRSDMQSEAQALGKYLPVMIRVSQMDDATPAFKRYVRQLVANL